MARPNTGREREASLCTTGLNYGAEGEEECDAKGSFTSSLTKADTHRIAKKTGLPESHTAPSIVLGTRADSKYGSSILYFFPAK
ncbi:unnamed protein product [Pleuronectes platessa]|uniref:Uncharacterized protein n=1 Tax=Pleuronectes platessa TaxID=8262 RepID=A0A9N7ZEG2_PLEPL|nr:unnamed protein product [Pleuronectes platessa]